MERYMICIPEDGVIERHFGSLLSAKRRSSFLAREENVSRQGTYLYRYVSKDLGGNDLYRAICVYEGDRWEVLSGGFRRF